MKLSMMLLVAAMSFAAVAEEPAKPGQAGGALPVERVVRMALNPKMVAKFGITEEQVAKLKALPDNREAIKTLQTKANQGNSRQAELLAAEKIDEAAVMAALDESWNARKKIAKLQTSRLIAVRAILTPDQISKVRSAMKSMKVKADDPKAEPKKGPKKGKRPAKNPEAS